MSVDHFLTRWINSFSGQNEFLDTIVRNLTLGGPFFLVLLVVLRWWAKENRTIQRHLALRCGLSTAFALLINQIITHIYARARPYELGITQLYVEKSNDPSFPSDHASVGFAIAFSLLLSKDKRSVFFLLAAFAISISRVLVGTHYFSDVLGGAATGAMTAFFVRRFFSKFNPITEWLVRFV